MQNEEGKITELYIPRKWCVISLFCLMFLFFFNIFYEFGLLNVISALPQTDSLLLRITPRFRLTLGTWTRMASTQANSPLSLSAVSSVLRFDFVDDFSLRIFAYCLLFVLQNIGCTFSVYYVIFVNQWLLHMLLRILLFELLSVCS